MFNSVSLEDPRDILTIGFVAVSIEELVEGLATWRRKNQSATIGSRPSSNPPH